MGKLSGVEHARDTMERLKDWFKERWGWVVVVTSFFNFFTGFGMLYSYGLLYIALQEEFNSAAVETAWIGSIAIGLHTLATLVSSGLVQKFGNRVICAVGIAMCVTSCISTSFMPCLPPIYFTFGILMGVGINFIVISSVNLILRYFPEENTSRATSLALVGTTAGMLAFSQVTHLLTTYWGWRNMLRTMGCIILLVGIPCCATYIQPLVDPLNPPIKKKKPAPDPVKEKGDQLAHYRKESTVNGGRRMSRRQSEVVFDKTIKEQLQVLLFPEMWFMALALLGCAMTMSFYYISFVSFMTTNGFEKHDCAMVMTVVALSEIAGKFLLSVVGDHLPFPKIFLFNIASILGIGVMFALFVAKSLWMMHCLAVVTGLVVMTIYDALPYSVCVEVFGPDRTIETSTVLLIANGLGLILGSLFGMSVDASGSYDAAIYTSIGIYVFSLFLWTGVPLYQKLVAKDRYIMSEFKQMQAEIKEEKEEEKLLQVKQVYLERTFETVPTIVPEYVFYEIISTV